MRNTLFISDTHLCDRYPEITQTLKTYLETQTAQTDAVYILGDLFDVWLGDDIQCQTTQTFKTLLKNLHKRGIPCFFIHGNRDFLLGETFAQQTGLTLLPEHCPIPLYNKPTLLLHGDTLCTFDASYQNLRKLFRNSTIQALFLSLPKRLRRWVGHCMRQQSRHNNRFKTAKKMDVNPQTIHHLCQKHQTMQLIHGHIHKPKIEKQTNYKRFVLGDWSHRGSVLVYYADHSHDLLSFPLNDALSL